MTGDLTTGDVTAFIIAFGILVVVALGGFAFLLSEIRRVHYDLVERLRSQRAVVEMQLSAISDMVEAIRKAQAVNRNYD